MNIPANLKPRIDEVIAYVADTTCDYLLVKRQLINNFPPSSRTLFSARHPCTKKHQLNEFDKLIISYWETKTGVKLVVDADKLHSDAWEHKKKGWALSLLNQERKQRHEERKANPA
jgi:hypothetical protein